MKYLLSSFFFLMVSASQSAVAQNYELVQVSVAPYEQSFTRAGKVAFRRTLNLSFKSSGYLKKLSVDEGDYFSSGQLLASLNTEELKAEKNTRYIALLQAKKDRNRIEKLLAENLSSEQALEQADTQVDTQREAYQVAYYNLEKAEIYAPFDGVVLSRFAELGEFQLPGQGIIEVAALDNNLVVKVRLTDREIGNVKLGQQVKVQTYNLGEVDGVISKVPVASNAIGQLYLIEVLLQNMKVNHGVVAGQLAQVNLEFASDTLVYKVPVSALVRTNQDGSAVLLTKIDENQFVRQSFEVLNIDNEFLYLRAQNHNETLDIVTRGWQQLKFSEQ